MGVSSLSCDEAPLLAAPLGSWNTVKGILNELVINIKDGVNALLSNHDAIMDLVSENTSEADCPLGYYSSRLAVYLLLSPSARNEQVCLEKNPSVLEIGTFLDVLSSGWPLFGLLGMLAYRLVRDGTTQNFGADRGRADCNAELESFRIRYHGAAFGAEDVQFSRDVERQVLEKSDFSSLESAIKSLTSRATNISQMCLYGEALPIVGHVVSLQCFGQRSASLRTRLSNALLAVEGAFLRPAWEVRGASGKRVVGLSRMCRAHGAELKGSVLGALAAGLWAAETHILLQKVAPLYAFSERLATQLETNVVVSYDSHEDKFYGRGFGQFVHNAFGHLPGFRVQDGLLCADVIVARDSLPPRPFLGTIVYLDHEAGLGPGRDAGRLDVLLAQHPVVYAGVLEPSSETRCVSRHGPPRAQKSRVCAKVFKGLAEWPVKARGNDREEGEPPPSLSVVHVPFASSSFMGRVSHIPADLLTVSRPFVQKARFVAYMAHTCVDHRERMFDLLVDSGLGDTVDALGRCTGFHSGHRRVRNHTRNVNRGHDFLDEAVELLKPYRFSLAFENKLVPGYVTEKIVNAFLADSIPIYWGSKAVLDMFNPDAFIYATDLQANPAGSHSDFSPGDPLVGLDRVVAQVARIAEDETVLRRISTAPILNDAQLQKYFSWHRSVGNYNPASADDRIPSRLAQAVRRALSLRSRLGLCRDESGRVCSHSY